MSVSFDGVTRHEADKLMEAIFPIVKGMSFSVYYSDPIEGDLEDEGADESDNIKP